MRSTIEATSITQLDFFNLIPFEEKEPDGEHTTGLITLFTNHSLEMMLLIRSIFVPNVSEQEMQELRDSYLYYMKLLKAINEGGKKPFKPDCFRNYERSMGIISLLYEQLLFDPKFPESMQTCLATYAPGDPNLVLQIKQILGPIYTAYRTNAVILEYGKYGRDILVLPDGASRSSFELAINQMFMTNGDWNKTIGSDYLVAEFYLYFCLLLKRKIQKAFDNL